MSLRRTLNENLLDNGFKIRDAIPDEVFTERFTPIMIEIAKGNYSQFRIVPGEDAIDGFDWEFVSSHHIVYVKNSERYSNGFFRPTQIEFRHKETGERAYLPLHTIKSK